MTHPEISRDELTAAARGFVRPGISIPVAFVLGFADLSGQPLNPEAFDDAAVILRCERLVDDGIGLSEALRTAHAERVTWRLPKGEA